MEFDEFLKQIMLSGGNNTYSHVKFDNYERAIQKLNSRTDMVLDPPGIPYGYYTFMCLNMIYKSIKYDNYKILFICSDSTESLLYSSMFTFHICELLEINGLHCHIDKKIHPCHIQFKNMSIIGKRFFRNNDTISEQYNDIFIDRLAYSHINDLTNITKHKLNSIIII